MSTSNRKIRKILVANRGEIALRIMRSAKEMGIRTVAIYSEADREALHVRYADEAVCVGPAPSSESYLRIDRILEACRQTGADAVHPGYGFLSENAHFARAVEEAGLIFIGPSPQSIELMGSKLAAKEAAKKQGVPLVPGTAEALTDVEEGKRIAREIGYPVLIKASAGGGGKGMRVVEKEEDFAEQMERAISEAISAFGDGAVFIEKYIASPKHIEIQVLGDRYGKVVYLFERECSIQRRHQKVIEEAPSAVVDENMRRAMGEAAVRVAKACGYYNAGTVEFIVDEQRNFYFLEMNTRLQVEHPVTEMITGIDLVKEQIRIAEGQPLRFSQEELKINGHAIEVRVYAEDPRNNFLPNVGKLLSYERPQGPGVRVDDAFEAGMQVPIYYDPMIAKLIVHAPSRQEAIDRMLRAIGEYKITGIATTLDFCAFALQHPAFTDGSFDTNFVKQYFTPEVLNSALTEEELQTAAAFVAHLWNEQKGQSQVLNNGAPANSQSCKRSWKIARRNI
ncbi:propionyl-CoA carboxylase alpha chain [Thermonema lapsum]|uniref:Propionyl-CoA carboxylase alpha chain n=1 Tax=Thermonema lapsum TaxID=28195 RepID=A0A846MR42_9BACT|nr:acetyl-CoA carboxylase biotin carboxylase subunit [Thermonema lapsum]NIK74128.1 propionyl-CoA carboxylase alpha chain [Thermonema lapsum]